jgi:hypothetical protein
MNTKIKLNYTQLCAFCGYLTEAMICYITNTYEQKTVMAVTIDWQIKKLLPHTYLPYQGDKKITLTPSQASAFVALYQATTCGIDDYAKPKVIELIYQIDSKIIH